MSKKLTLQRVDIQVATLIAVMVIISGFILFLFAYTLSYREMINSLEERVNAIAEYTEKTLNPNVFQTVLSKEQIEDENYITAHKLLSTIKEISSAQYLYTATKRKDGTLIYHIDGLDESSEDFRYPGDLIEPDFQPDLERALNNEIVMPDDIINSAWGDVFVAYYPIHDKNGNVIGALGVEFPANKQYEAYRYIRILTPFILLITCIIAIFISGYLFRRISNPHFRDLSNTDSLTKLKNRNAYTLDVNNLIRSNRISNCALVLADLNSLKVVNDKFGHKAGDEYISAFASSIESSSDKDHVAYRIGGDEFAIIFFNVTQERLETYCEKVKRTLVINCAVDSPCCGVSMGYAFCEANTEEAFEKMQVEADQALYANKKSFYEAHSHLDKRSS